MFGNYVGRNYPVLVCKMLANTDNVNLCSHWFHSNTLGLCGRSEPGDAKGSVSRKNLLDIEVTLQSTEGDSRSTSYVVRPVQSCSTSLANWHGTTKEMGGLEACDFHLHFDRTSFRRGFGQHIRTVIIGGPHVTPDRVHMSFDSCCSDQVLNLSNRLVLRHYGVDK